MAERLILCSGCGVKNRLPEGKRSRPKCGKCGKPIAVPRDTRGFVRLFQKPLTWLVVAGLVFVGYLAAKKQSNGSRAIGTRASNSMKLPKPPPKLELSKPSPAPGYKPPYPPGYTPSFTPDYKQLLKPPFNAKPVPVSHGVLQPPSSPGVVPFLLKTRAGNNYYVKLVDLAGQLVMTVYAEGGSDLEVGVPLGTFEIRYASGKTWYGTKLLFGPETLYAKADKQFRFYSDGIRYSGHKVELIPQLSGNLRTVPLSPNEF